MANNVSFISPLPPHIYSHMPLNHNQTSLLMNTVEALIIAMDTRLGKQNPDGFPVGFSAALYLRIL